MADNIQIHMVQLPSNQQYRAGAQRRTPRHGGDPGLEADLTHLSPTIGFNVFLVLGPRAESRAVALDSEAALGGQAAECISPNSPWDFLISRAGEPELSASADSHSLA